VAIAPARIERAAADAALVAERIPLVHAAAQDGDRLARALDARLVRNDVAELGARRAATRRQRLVTGHTPGGAAMDAWLDLGLDARRHLRALARLLGEPTAWTWSEAGVAAAIRRVGALVAVAGERGMGGADPVRAAVAWLALEVRHTAAVTGAGAPPDDGEPLDQPAPLPTAARLPACRVCGRRSWALSPDWLAVDRPTARCACGTVVVLGDLPPDELPMLLDPPRIAADAARTAGVPIDTVLSWVRRERLAAVDRDGAGRPRYEMAAVRELARQATARSARGRAAA